MGKMIEGLYRWLYRATARSDERGEYSGGRWEGLVRQHALALCKGARGKLLEIGSGAGLFVLKLAAQEPGLEVWGVDTNEAMLDEVDVKARALDLKNVRLEMQDARTLLVSDETFDTVVCINLFLNIDLGSVRAVLQEMKRVCKTGGRLIFEFRNSRNLFFVLKYKFARYYDTTAPYPLYTYSPGAIEALLKELGLTVKTRVSLGFPVKGLAPIILIEAVKP